MTTILLVRHGETDWNREGRWQGHADPSLNELGREQARALATRVLAEPIDAIYSSDLARARETAAIVGAGVGLEPRLDPRLREVDVGEWSGLTSDEVERRYPGAVERRRSGGVGWERGESYEQMSERVIAGLHAIAEVHRGGRVLVVTHGGPMRAVWLACGGSFETRPVVANCDVHRVVVENGALRRID